MPVEDNLRLIKRVYEAINDRDWDTVFALHSEDHLRFDTNRSEPTKGLELYRKYTVGFADAFPDLHIEVVRAFGQRQNDPAQWQEFQSPQLSHLQDS